MEKGRRNGKPKHMTTKNKHQFICTDSIKGMFFFQLNCITFLVALQLWISKVSYLSLIILMSLSKIAHGLSKISHKSVFSWKSACKNTLQRSFSYSVSSKSVSVKMCHCSLALTKICSHDWQRRQLIIATIHFVIPIPHISQNFWRVKFTPKFIQ